MGYRGPREAVRAQGMVRGKEPYVQVRDPSLLKSPSQDARGMQLIPEPKPFLIASNPLRLCAKCDGVGGVLSMDR
jgi:hypothetical protein